MPRFVSHTPPTSLHSGFINTVKDLGRFTLPKRKAYPPHARIDANAKVIWTCSCVHSRDRYDKLTAGHRYRARHFLRPCAAAWQMSLGGSRLGLAGYGDVRPFQPFVCGGHTATPGVSFGALLIKFSQFAPPRCLLLGWRISGRVVIIMRLPVSTVSPRRAHCHHPSWFRLYYSGENRLHSLSVT